VNLDGPGREVPCEPETDWPEGGVAGKRRWLDDPEALPFMCDGGCGQINVEFDPVSRTVTAFCNGRA
jgi:hypothetical protein